MPPAPNDLAVIDDRGQMTYQQLAAASAGLGMYLTLQTKRPSVGILLPGGGGFMASFYGTLIAGKSVVPINYLLGDREIAHVIDDSGIDVVVTAPPLSARLKDARINVIDLTQLPQTPPAAIAPTLPSPSPDDLAVLIYTSGTSGLPKGVELSYGNLESCVSASIEWAQLKEKHTFLGVVPPFHSLGLIATVIAPVRLGSMVFCMARFSAVGAVNAIREYKLSLIFAVPSMFAAMLHLKSAVGRGLLAHLRDDQRRRAVAANRARAIHRAFRQTAVRRLRPDRNLRADMFQRSAGAAPGSVGEMLPGTSVKFVDDDGNPQTNDKGGEIWLKGPMIMQGYHNLPTETAAALTADGFFKTGDLGRMDDDGFLYITGRKKEMIIIAGEKASPREIEETLMQHAGVADAAVIGKKDASRGEVAVAFVIAKEGQTLKPEDLRDFCRNQGLAQWKCPREVYFVKELPRSPTGKVLKRTLAEQLDQA